MPTAPPAGSPFEVLRPDDLRRHASLKWTHYGPDVLPAWVAEMDVLPPPEVVEALTRAVRTGDIGYPGNPQDYAEALAELAAVRWGWTVRVEHAMAVADTMTGIGAVVRLAGAEGRRRVVMPGPVYPPFASFSREAGARVRHVRLTEHGRWDLAAIEEAVAEEPCVLLLCSPHNPTGVVNTADELLAVAELAQRHRAFVVVDEVHGPLVHSDTVFVPWLSVADHGLVVTSAAKGFNLAGLKAALLLASPRDAGVLERLPASLRYGSSQLGLVGHAAAYRAAPTWLDGVNAAIAANVRRLEGRLAEQLPSVRMLSPQATYLVWLDLRALGLGEDPAEPLLERGRVALTSGLPFGPGAAGFARVNVACSVEVLDEVVSRMASAVRGTGTSSSPR